MFQNAPLLETVFLAEPLSTKDILGNDWGTTFDLCYRVTSHKGVV